MVLFAWLPLLVLSAAEGVLVGGTTLPFFDDEVRDFVQRALRLFL
ncbi:hypothetical protein [Nannocystis exedens]|nr:hypothetical protein [Nannocystis exedens]